MRIAKGFFFISSLIICFWSIGLAQKNRLSDFNKGYYLKNAGERFEGLIRYNMGWFNTHIEYKQVEVAKVSSVQVDSCKEFGLQTGERFVRCHKGLSVQMGRHGPYVKPYFLEWIAEGKLNAYLLKVKGEISESSGNEKILFSSGTNTIEEIPYNEKKLRRKWHELIPENEVLANQFADLYSVEAWQQLIILTGRYNANNGTD